MSRIARPASPAPAEPAGAARAALFVEECLDAVRAAALRGPVLDLACGRGRNALAVARAGARVVALDRDAVALRGLAQRARGEGLALSVVRADLESGHDLPFRDAAFGAVLVFRYLHRPIAAAIEALLAPGGLLLYETFRREQRDLGYGPVNPAFLLEDGELNRLFPGLRTEACEEGRFDEDGRRWACARLLARKPR